MKDVVFNEVVSGRRIMVFKHTKPWTYYAGYIQLYPLDDPAEWIAQVNNRNEDYFDRLDEFSEFPYGVTYAGNLSIDGEWWVEFDTSSAPLGDIDEEECIDALKATALILKIRATAVKDAVDNLAVKYAADNLAVKYAADNLKDKNNKASDKQKNVGLLLETVNDLANAAVFNKTDETDKANKKLENAGINLMAFLDKELNVSPEDVAMFTILKTALSEDEDEDDE